VISVRNGRPGRARLASLGAYVPERVVTNAEMEERVDTTDAWIVSRTGIRERRFAAPEQASSDLGAIAAERALAAAGVAAEDVDMVIVGTSSPDHVFPSTGAILGHRIGARNAAAYDVLAACSSFVYGLAQGSALVEAGLARTVLVVGTEALSKMTDQTDRATCILFGDGAGAAVLTAAGEDEVTGFVGFDLGADGGGGGQLSLPAGGSRLPMPFADDPRLGYLQMNGPEVFRFATRIMVESAERLLEAAGMTIEDLDLVVPHQANSRIIDHAAERLGIPSDLMWNNVDRFGNTSAASIPLALTEARDAGRLQPGHLVLMVGFGAGLTWGSTIVRYEPVTGGAGA
jgi:3-oxoacyl-[acyl-carrier-protein] synthase III